MQPETKPTHTEVEHVKNKSDYLPGTLVESLANTVTGALNRVTRRLSFKPDCTKPWNRNFTLFCSSVLQRR